MPGVLVTRPEPGASATAARIAALGHAAILAPLMRIKPLAPARLFSDLPDLVVMTSAAAPAAIARHRDLDALSGIPAFVVGEKTAVAARAIGFRVAEVAPDLATLAPILSEVAAGRLLHIAGVDRSGDLAALSGRDGIETIEVYRAEILERLPPAAHAALAEDRVDGVLHFSRRSAQAFFALAGEAGLGGTATHIRQFCIAPGVAEIARAAFCSRIYVAEHPQEDAMIDLIARFMR